MDFIEKYIEKNKKKVTKYIILIVAPILFFLLVIAAIYELVFGTNNSNQATSDNATIQQGEKSETIVYSVLCQNCPSDTSSEKDGIMGSEFMEKMSEMINLYNNLELEEERVDELDYILLTTTISYGKKMHAEIFQDSTLFGNWINEENLTNGDINSFPNTSEIDVETAQRFYKWASVALGTPYALPDINLRGLSGNLITGKVVTTCVKGNNNKSVEAQDEELIKEIIEIEKKLSGETVDESWWDKILSIFSKKYDSDEKVLEDRLKKMFEGTEFEDLLYYVNLDYYDPELQCQSGYMRKNTYTKFMNYNQYQVYLEKVFVPETYINCDECLHKNSSDYNKSVMAKKITDEIFQLAEYNRNYFGMTNIDYSREIAANEEGITKIDGISSPLKSACSVTSPYGMRGSSIHTGIDTQITSNDFSLYAVADGVVEAVNIYTTENIGHTYSQELGKCPPLNGVDVNSGIEIIIRHEIDGTTYKAKYAHLDPNGIEVSSGDTVKKGQKIANMGNTGCSTARHLHFEITANGEYIDPSFLFSQCEGSSETGVLKIETTDNFVTSEKCMVGDLTLDEVITGLIKKDNSNAAISPEYVKSLAIVIRTNLMKETNWCNEKIEVDVNIDIENNASDLMIYNYVIDTQGMVLNYSGALLNNVDYAKFPCEKLPNDWRNPGNTNRVLSTLGISNQPEWTDEFIEMVDNALAAYNAQCITYAEKGGNVTVNFGTIPKEVKETYKSEYSAIITIPKSAITDTSRNAQSKFSTIAALYKSKTETYTKILHDFYASKTKIGADYEGVVDISTSPGLIDAKRTVIDNILNTSQSFTYGETLPGTTNIPTGNMSVEELQMINEHLKNYIDTAEANAIAAGDINPKRARVMAAAYWLIYNPFYRVQYQWGKPLEHDNYDGIGWDPDWSSVRGIECQNFVVWALWNAGAKSVYPTWSRLQHSKEYIDNGDTDFTVGQVIDAGIQVGDVLRKSRTEGENGHWSIVMTVADNYIEVAHATNEQVDTTITRYYRGDAFHYQHLYKLPEFYQDS